MPEAVGIARRVGGRRRAKPRLISTDTRWTQVVVATLRWRAVCDGGSAAFGSGSAEQAEVAWAAASGAAGAPAAVLGLHCRGFVERGCGDGGGGIAAGREPMVSRGGWDGAVALVAVVGAVLRALSLVCRAGADRALASAGFGRAGGRTSPGAGGVDGVAGAAAQCGDAGRQPGLRGVDRAVAR
jgi:hypothetical protein